MEAVDEVIESAVRQGSIPGAVLLVGGRDRAHYCRAYGWRALLPDRVPMTVDTVFDLASLSKPVGCATSVMKLVERGQVLPPESLGRYLPEFAAAGKEAITVEHLLLHVSGLIADNPLRDYADGPQNAWARICALSPLAPPGTRFIYSDVGYIVLGELVGRISGLPLDQFAKREIFEPLGMKDTTYCPPPEYRRRCAPTEQRDEQWMIGEVHDPRAWLLGGVAGHAGIFSTADDLARYCRMILRGGVGDDGRRVLNAQTVDLMTQPRCLSDGTNCRTYGFDVDTPYSSARGDVFPARQSFGHTGFTGTSFWIDPTRGVYVILLTNRVHPDGKGQVVELRRRVATLAAEALSSPAGAVRPAA